VHSQRHITEVTINGLRLTRSRAPLLVASKRWAQPLDKNFLRAWGKSENFKVLASKLKPDKNKNKKNK